MQNKFCFKNLILCALVPTLTSAMALAGNPVVVNPGSISQAQATSDAAAAASAAANIGGGGGGNAAQSAQQAGGSQSGAQMAAAIMAALLAAQCNPQTNPMACVMAPMAAAQAASLGGSADGSAASQAALSTAAAPVIGSTNGTASQIAGGALTTLASKGVTPNPDGSVSLADGSSIPASAAGGADAAAAAGFSQAQIAAGQVSLADAQAKTKEKMKSFVTPLSGGGSEGGGGGGGSSGSSVAAMPDFGLPRKSSRPKPSLAGMSKNLGGDKIGVAGDNIFEMVTRRYKARDAENNFFKN